MLKVGGGKGQMPPQDFGMEQQPQDMPMDGMPPMDPQMAGGDPMQQDAGGMPPMDDMSQDNSQSQFDTNFDAGVEADEDTDPKKYIQQLTGKLSTTLNNYNGENDDEGLNKYVAKMIVKASLKNASDATKKDVIKAINTASNEEPSDEEEPDAEQTPTEEVPQGDEQLSGNPMMENVVTKKNIKEAIDVIKQKM